MSSVQGHKWKEGGIEKALQRAGRKPGQREQGEQGTALEAHILNTENLLSSSDGNFSSSQGSLLHLNSPQAE